VIFGVNEYVYFTPIKSSKQENESKERESDSEQDEESDDDDQEEEEFDQENESEDDEMKSDEEQGMDDITDQFDTDARLEEPTETATGIIHGEGNDTEMTEAQQSNENLETTQEQVVEDAHVTISIVPKKTEVPVTSSSRSSDLASKFLKILDIPQTDAEIVSPLDVHVHHEVPRTQAPTLLTIPISVIHESSPEVSNFAPPVIENLIKESRDEVTLAKVSSQPQSTYEAASTLTEFELKKILLDKMEKNKDKDEDPSAGSDSGLKKRKTSGNGYPTKGRKTKPQTTKPGTE
ncbi:hypothetical protein Tco_0944601, partial [Tanacetum coccineum]